MTRYLFNLIMELKEEISRGKRHSELLVKIDQIANEAGLESWNGTAEGVTRELDARKAR